MKSILVSTLILFSSFKPLSAQISGFVVDKEGLAIPYANVMLQSASNDIILSGTITDDHGNFRLKSENEEVLYDYKTRRPVNHK